MEKHTIINLKLQGQSNREIARNTGIDRKTVAKYWNEYQKTKKLLNTHKSNINTEELKEAIISHPKPKPRISKPRKYTNEIDKRIDELLLSETNKDKMLGTHKQKLTKQQIFDILKEEDFDISYSTISNRIKDKITKSKECFIRQKYEYGDRLEYDFGEVKLNINGTIDKYYLAVLSSPASNFRWAYLYENSKKEIFMDSHVNFFEMVGGVYKEVVYDNMRNVVSKFIGINEKKLNEDLIKMSLYYGYVVNVTNCYKGNEKGHVEGSVKIIRNKVYAKNYKFNSLVDAREYLNSKLIKMNKESKIEDEKNNLLPYLPKLELAELSENKVDKYSFIRIDNNFYSVPDYLVGRKVSVKKYFDKICIYSNSKFVYEHKKVKGNDEIIMEIKHYLDTFYKKPGALKNSLALKRVPELKHLFDNYYIKNPKDFIAILKKHQDKSIKEIIKRLRELVSENNLINKNSLVSSIYQNTKLQLSKYDDLCVRKEGKYEH